MAGANIIRKQSEQAAMDIYNRDYSPTGIGISGVGNLSWLGDRPMWQGAPGMAQTGDVYSGLFRGLSGDVAGLRDVPVEFARRAQAASGSLFDQLNQFDPIESARSRFGELQSIIAPQQAAAREAQQAQLLRQGRLGGTSGDAREAALAAAQSAQDIQLANQLYGEAEQSQRNMLADAMAAGQTAAGQYGGLFSQLGQAQAGQQAAVQGQLGPFAQLVALSQSIPNQRLQQDIARSQAINAYNTAIAGSSGASGGMFSQLAPGLITGGLTAAGTMFGGPVGGMAAGSIFGGGGSPAPQTGGGAMNGAGLFTSPYWQ